MYCKVQFKGTNLTQFEWASHRYVTTTCYNHVTTNKAFLPVAGLLSQRRQVPIARLPDAVGLHEGGDRHYPWGTWGGGEKVNMTEFWRRRGVCDLMYIQ